jgi:hypothetical protein
MVKDHDPQAEETAKSFYSRKAKWIFSCKYIALDGADPCCGLPIGRVQEPHDSTRSNSAEESCIFDEEKTYNSKSSGMGFEFIQVGVPANEGTGDRQRRFRGIYVTRGFSIWDLK